MAYGPFISCLIWFLLGVLVMALCIFLLREPAFMEKEREREKRQVQNASVCTFRTSPCAPATRPHVFNVMASRNPLIQNAECEKSRHLGQFSNLIAATCPGPAAQPKCTPEPSRARNHPCQSTHPSVANRATKDFHESEPKGCECKPKTSARPSHFGSSHFARTVHCFCVSPKVLSGDSFLRPCEPWPLLPRGARQKCQTDGCR